MVTKYASAATTSPPSSPSGRVPRAARSRRRPISGSWWPYFLPAMIIVLVINGSPVLYSAYLSLRNEKLSRPGQAKFVGLQNYMDLILDPAIQRSFMITISFVLLSVGLSLIFGMALALLVNSVSFGKKVFRTLFFMPMLLAPAIVGVMWRFLLNDQAGPVTWMLHLLAPGASPLSDPTLAFLTVVFVDVWSWTPFVFLVLLAGLDAAPMEPLEAAQVDGANPVQTFWHITLPSLIPLISVAVLFRVTWSFRSFDQIYTLTQGGPGGATEVLALSVYRSAFVNLDVSLGAALSVVMFLIMLTFAMSVLRGQRKRESQ